MADDREPKYMHAWFCQSTAVTKGSSWYEADDGRHVEVTHVSNYDSLPEEVTSAVEETTTQGQKFRYVGLVGRYLEVAKKGHIQYDLRSLEKYPSLRGRVNARDLGYIEPFRKRKCHENPYR